MNGIVEKMKECKDYTISIDYFNDGYEEFTCWATLEYCEDKAYKLLKNHKGGGIAEIYDYSYNVVSRLIK